MYLIVIDAVFSAERKAEIIEALQSCLVWKHIVLSLSAQRSGSRSYPANSSSRDTFSSGGMVNTDWDRASFLCFFDTTRLGEEITSKQAEKRKTSCYWIWFHIWPQPQRQEEAAGHSEPPPGAINTCHFSSLLWNFRLMTPELLYLGSVPPILVIYKSSSFVLFQLQKKTSDDDFHTKQHALCASSAWWCRTLTFFEEGNHFINNILELPIRPAEKKNIQISSCQLNTLMLRDFKIDFEIVKKKRLPSSTYWINRGKHGFISRTWCCKVVVSHGRWCCT